MADNRFFIVDVPNPNMTQIFDICVGEGATQRFSLDGLRVLIKLPKNDSTNHGVLSTSTEYTRAEILTEIQHNTEWEINPLI